MLNLETVLHTIGSRIAQRRKELNLTQDDLALLADIDRTYIGYIENGKQNISISVLLKLANALEVELDYFLHE